MKTMSCIRKSTGLQFRHQSVYNDGKLYRDTVYRNNGRQSDL